MPGAGMEAWGKGNASGSSLPYSTFPGWDWFMLLFHKYVFDGWKVMLSTISVFLQCFTLGTLNQGPTDHLTHFLSFFFETESHSVMKLECGGVISAHCNLRL